VVEEGVGLYRNKLEAITGTHAEVTIWG